MSPQSPTGPAPPHPPPSSWHQPTSSSQFQIDHRQAAALKDRRPGPGVRSHTDEILHRGTAAQQQALASGRLNSGASSCRPWPPLGQYSSSQASSADLALPSDSSHLCSSVDVLPAEPTNVPHARPSFPSRIAPPRIAPFALPPSNALPESPLPPPPAERPIAEQPGNTRGGICAGPRSLLVRPLALSHPVHLALRLQRLAIHVQFLLRLIIRPFPNLLFLFMRGRRRSARLARSAPVERVLPRGHPPLALVDAQAVLRDGAQDHEEGDGGQAGQHGVGRLL